MHDFTTVLRPLSHPSGAQHWRTECSCGFIGMWHPERDRLARSIAIHLAVVAGDYGESIAMVRYANAEKYMPEARAILAEIGAER